MRNYIILGILYLLPATLFAQIRGVITDSLTNEPLMYISVYYEGKDVGTTSNTKGEYRLESVPEWREVTFSAIGYEKKTVRITPNTRVLNVQMRESDIMLSEVVVKPKREKYSKKNNPAVDFMRKVIEHKSNFTLEENDYYRYDKYQKMKTSLNNLTLEGLDKGIFKKFPFFKDRIEVSLESQKLILPLSIQETSEEVIFRKNPKNKKTILKGTRSNGIDEFFATGDMVGTVLNDVFTDVSIYDNDIRLLRQRFVSPISNLAISFYKFYLMDTLVVDRRECVHLTFVPQNSQDFGFTGHLYVVKDSTYAVKKCQMSLPINTGVNFVERFDLTQQFDQLANGNWVLTDDDLVIDLFLYDFISEGAQVRRTTKYSNFLFDPIAEARFEQKGDVIKEPKAKYCDEEFWADARLTPLTEKEENMGELNSSFEQMGGFRYLIFGLKLFLENYVETGGKNKPSKFDIGPVNTFISSNYVDGMRLRFGGQTTAALNPHWFVKGYAAYGFKDKKWKYEGSLTYAFKKREFFPWEFPRHNLSIRYRYDVMSPMDKFLTTDKDNVFVAWKTTKVDQMSYVRDVELKHEIETMGGLSITTSLLSRNDQPTGKLQYIRNDNAGTVVHDITTSELGVTLSYTPGQTYINSKQRRRAVNHDAPTFMLSHHVGARGVLGSEYNYNLTEATAYKRIWLSSWGKAEVTVKAGMQWDQVPFPLLIVPEANLSYITQAESFNLMNNMEFLNDRYASLAVTYDMGGKLLNRIPLLKKLKWRETFRFRALWGDLSDKNNPALNQGDGELFLFPTRNGQTTSFVMEPGEPYMEACVGIYNIFKLLHIEYVRRLSYLNHPNINKHGIRFAITMTF